MNLVRPRRTAPAAARGAGTDSLVTLRSRPGVALIAGTVLASMVAFLDASVVNVAVPAIGRSLGAGVAGVQWVVAAYLLTAAALLLPAGAVIDHFGRRRVLVAGLLVMLVASVLCAVAPTTGTLIGARLVQGAGAALVVPSSLALLNGTLRVAERARGIGVWAGLATIGMTLGPYAGGWLVDVTSWRYLFLLNVPLVLGALAVLRHVPDVHSDRRPLSLDVAGAVLSVAGLGGAIYALMAGPAAGWLSVRVLLPGVVGVLCLVALVPVERRQESPMLRLSLFASRQFDAINVTTLLLYGALAAGGYLLVLQVQLQLGYSATAAGAILIPESVVFLLVSPVVGGLVGRFGPRRLMVVGILFMAGAFFALSAVEAGDGYVAAVLPGALLWGLGLGLTVAPLTAGVLAAVSDEDLGEASAVNDAASRVGALLLVALVPVLVGVGSGELGPALADGYRPAMLVMCGLTLAAAAVTAVFVSDRPAPLPPMPVPPRVHSCALPVDGPTLTGTARP
ncbi:MFS transporter [Blastococcus litoris]|uniref:MFS transporter n=1 Tax=Blastococcus litoris TaxID=2171622 RepID=UPI000E30145C|nr:MFS transporter [Blastococcus litoris]